MQLIALVEVVTFWQGNCYVSRTLLSTVNATKRGTINWAEWFKVRWHKVMIAVQRKVGKVGNSLIGLTLSCGKTLSCIRVHIGR